MGVKKISPNELGDLCRELAQKVEKPDIIISTGDGGPVVGKMLSSLLRVPLAFVSCEKYSGDLRSNWLIASPRKIIKQDKVLIVDAAVRDGETLQETLEEITLRLPYNEIQTAVLHYNPKSRVKPDYFVRRINSDTWIQYPYEIEFIS